MLSVKRSATCSTRGGSQEMYITFASAMRIRQNPLWLWNPEETSPEIQNRGTSGPKIGHVNVSDKKTLKKKKKRVEGILTETFLLTLRKLQLLRAVADSAGGGVQGRCLPRHKPICHFTCLPPPPTFEVSGSNTVVSNFHRTKFR